MRQWILTAAAAAVCVCSLIPHTACAAPPRATVTGPTGGMPGDILVLDASASNADFYAWNVTPELPDDRPTILPLDEGEKCLVCSVPGVYTVILAVSNPEGIDQIKWTVTVGNGPTPPVPPPVPPGPEPPPNPVPPNPPEPEPDLPVGVYDISRFARDGVANVSSPTKTTEAHALAAAFTGIAARIAAGTLTNPRLILAALLQANNDALGASMPLWVQYGTALGKRIEGLVKAGRVASPEEWATLMREIALGLAAVK